MCSEAVCDVGYDDGRLGVPGMKYRKKPVVVEAIRCGPPWRATAEWCRGWPIKDGARYSGILIPTLEGKMIADEGDFIIKGIGGEFSPCKPDIFEATYEPVECQE
jgi:hypothetical protein